MVCARFVVSPSSSPSPSPASEKKKKSRSPGVGSMWRGADGEEGGGGWWGRRGCQSRRSNFAAATVAPAEASLFVFCSPSKSTLNDTREKQPRHLGETLRRRSLCKSRNDIVYLMKGRGKKVGYFIIPVLIPWKYSTTERRYKFRSSP